MTLSRARYSKTGKVHLHRPYRGPVCGSQWRGKRRTATADVSCLKCLSATDMKTVRALRTLRLILTEKEWGEFCKKGYVRIELVGRRDIPDQGCGPPCVPCMTRYRKELAAWEIEKNIPFVTQVFVGPRGVGSLHLHTRTTPLMFHRAGVGGRPYGKSEMSNTPYCDVDAIIAAVLKAKKGDMLSGFCGSNVAMKRMRGRIGSIDTDRIAALA